MSKKIVNNLLTKIGADKVGSISEAETIMRNRSMEYENASPTLRAQMFGEINYKATMLEYKVNEMLKQIPSIAEIVHNVDALSETLRITTMEYFKGIFIDFDGSAANSVGQMVYHAINHVKKQELVAYREGSYAYVSNLVMRKIEQQGENGNRRSKSKFILDLKRNPDKLKVFEDALYHYVKFRWTVELMKEGIYSNSIVDELAERRVELALNKNALLPTKNNG